MTSIYVTLSRSDDAGLTGGHGGQGKGWGEEWGKHTFKETKGELKFKKNYT